ncbi:MAG TPA: saccharopine dehydrogenase NADP-binding domain-containing protein [Pyrinomonadaceae bacterium]|nr:saccharopine dehydrogenase NADP-binding domain-containing protein [Pyrinomonadaceae bacterium]
MRNKNITVFGAYGHTGRFVVAELFKRGWTPILAGRDEAKLKVTGNAYTGSEVRIASIDDPASLDRALDGAAAVINCAGPFLDTAAPLIEAALRARIHYLDVTAEQMAAFSVFEQYADAARDADIVIAPAMAFYGGLGDLMATATMGDWTSADQISIAIALDSWKPTKGTRLTGERNTARRVVLSKYKLEFLADPPSTRSWDFPAPFGTQDVVELPLTEMITISRHLQVPEIRSYMNLTPLTDLRDPNTPEPTAADESGRSEQAFLMDVVVTKGEEARRKTAYGRDIYAITAPIVAEAVERILDGRIKRTGVAAGGEIFDAEDFLQKLSASHISFGRSKVN